MSGSDTLDTIGGKVTGVFLSAFGGTKGVSLVFLPFALPAPDDVVQGGIVNPTRLAAFLQPNFDAPYLVSQSQYTVHGIELSYGAASQIYALAASSAQPVAPSGSDIWKRVNAEIAAAQSGLTPGGIAGAMTSVPDDWIVPENTSYWSTFDSTQVTTAPPPPDPPAGAPVVAPHRINPVLWSLRAAPAQLSHAETTAAPHVMAAAPSALIPRVAMMQPLALAAHPATAAAPATPPAHLMMQPMAELSPALQKPAPSATLPPGVILHHFPIVFPHPAPPPPPPPPPPPTSTMTVHFDYMSATIGFMAAGMPIWNGVFLADKAWCVPGMARGGLLPDPNATAAAAAPDATPPQLAYGLPISIILVRNLTISVKWAGQEQAQLGDSGFLGPFSLAGASVTASDGTVTYARPGIQVIALTCSTLPVLPPSDPPPETAAPSVSAPTTASPDATAAPTQAAQPPSTPPPDAPPAAVSTPPAAAADSTATTTAPTPTPAPAAAPSTS